MGSKIVKGFDKIIKKIFTKIKESLIVFKGIGIQIEKKQLNAKKSKKFLDISKFKDIVIHEVIFQNIEKKNILI